MLTLWQWVVAFRFPLHQPATPVPGTNPPVTLLKPLKGIDEKTLESLESWLKQAYSGEVEVLFGVAAEDDPVCKPVTELLARHPKANTRLVICPENLGANAKVSTLIQLMRLARHEIIMVSDADVWAPAATINELVQPLKDPSVGLVNCFYHLSTASNFAMRWEAFAVNADFWSQVLQSQSLKPNDFALGAVMATTRQRLAAIGGFESLADYLADDYQLGHKIARTGARIVLARIVVECRSDTMDWKEVWSHQLRWARTICVCQPVPFFLSQIHNPTLWPLLWMALQPTSTVLAIAAAGLLTRGLTGFYCNRKLTRRADLNAFWLAPIKDLLQTSIWSLAFFRKKVHWRGQTFFVRSGGKLERTSGGVRSGPVASG